jgi:hypothetical protein
MAGHRVVASSAIFGRVAQPVNREPGPAASRFLMTVRRLGRFRLLVCYLGFLL